MDNQVIFQDLGLMSYEKAWNYQQELLAKAIEIKRNNRNLSDTDPLYQQQQHYLLFCEHPPVFTLGRSGKKDHLLLDEAGLQKEGIEFHKINRGGDITYHGPGQLVVYPIFDLDCFFTDVHRYVRTLEEVVIQMLAEYDIQGYREKGYTGVWLKGNTILNQRKRKICAIGVHLSRWVTMHGFALNVHPNLDHFNHIIPCGIQEADKDISSMYRELEGHVSMEEVKKKVQYHFAQLFEFEYCERTV